MENTIEIKNLSKSYKDFTLQNISLNVPCGTVLGLIGQNGAGKSTLIRAMLNLTNASYDKIHIFGKDLIQDEKEIKEDIAVIYDTTHYNLNFTPKFIGTILSKVYKNWDAEKYKNYLIRFGLKEKNRLKTFSKGMKMKLEFAIALSHDPKLLILDEATSGLDPIFRDEILEILREYSLQENHTVLISSHITSDLEKIADYIAFINDGRLEFMKSYDEITENYGVIQCGKDTYESLNEEDILYVQKEAYGYKVFVQNRLAIQAVYKDLEIHRASIEDMMLYTSKRQGGSLC